MAYVDGFVTPVPKRRLEAYRRMSRKFGKIWREHGALEFRECIADDVKWGKRTSAQRQAENRRDRVLLLHHLQIARRSRPRQREGDEGQAPREDDGPEGAAL